MSDAVEGTADPIQTQLIHVVVHGMLKDGAAFRPDEREAVLPPSATVERVVKRLSEVYAKRTGKAHGKFESDEDNFPVQRYLREYIEDERSFLQLSQAMVRTLCAKAQGTAATGGTVLIAHTLRDETDFLIVAVLTEEWGATLDAEKSINDGQYLDLKHFRFAGQINVSDWQGDSERYLSFLKGRNSEVAEYFKLFLGCNHSVAAVHDTKKFIEVLDHFVKAQGFNDVRKKEFEDSAHKVCLDLAKSGVPLDLEEFANRTWPEDPITLLDMLCDERYGISDGFVPDRRSLKTLVKFEGKTPHWKIEFSREALALQQVSLNTDQSLTIRNLPDDLLGRIQREIE